ncbi:threalose-6-phosphate phosphatase, partial [Lobosporangium transversale]
HVLRHTAQFWAKSFIEELTLHASTWDQSTPTPYLDHDNIIDQYHKAKKRLLMFDYDGTLTPIRKTPGAAVPQEHMLKALSALAADPKNIVWIISGRDQQVLEEWLGHVEGLGFSAEHGSFMRQPGSTKWSNLTETLDMSWKNDVTEIFAYYTERTQGSFIEHKRSSITWHYRMADPEFGAFQAKECQNHLENAVLSKLPVEILVGKKNLEARPTIVNKGEIVKRLLSQHPDVEFVLCAGDDKTDEDMFRAMAGSNNAHNSRKDSSTVIESYKETHATETEAKSSEVTNDSFVSQDGSKMATTSDDASSTSSASSIRTDSSLSSQSALSSHSNSISGHFSITIGHALKKTLADWHVTSPEELIRVLGILSGTIDN